jgi:hypothetical protein
MGGLGLFGFLLLAFLFSFAGGCLLYMHHVTKVSGIGIVIIGIYKIDGHEGGGFFGRNWGFAKREGEGEIHQREGGRVFV